MEITANASQLVAPTNNVLFTSIRIPGNCSMLYQEGSGLVTLRGLRNGQNRSRFRVTFSANINADKGASITAATPISLGITQNGELIPISTMTATVEDTTSIFNVGTEILIDIPTYCCQTISVKNITSGTSVDVSNANLIVERVA